MSGIYSSTTTALPLSSDVDLPSGEVGNSEDDRINYPPALSLETFLAQRMQQAATETLHQVNGQIFCHNQLHQNPVSIQISVSNLLSDKISCPECRSTIYRSSSSHNIFGHAAGNESESTFASSRNFSQSSLVTVQKCSSLQGSSSQEGKLKDKLDDSTADIPLAFTENAKLKGRTLPFSPYLSASRRSLFGTSSSLATQLSDTGDDDRESISHLPRPKMGATSFDSAVELRSRRKSFRDNTLIKNHLQHQRRNSQGDVVQFPERSRRLSATGSIDSLQMCAISSYAQRPFNRNFGNEQDLQYCNNKIEKHFTSSVEEDASLGGSREKVGIALTTLDQEQDLNVLEENLETHPVDRVEQKEIMTSHNALSNSSNATSESTVENKGLSTTPVFSGVNSDDCSQIPPIATEPPELLCLGGKQKHFVSSPHGRDGKQQKRGIRAYLKLKFRGKTNPATRDRVIHNVATINLEPQQNLTIGGILRRIKIPTFLSRNRPTPSSFLPVQHNHVATATNIIPRDSAFGFGQGLEPTLHEAGQIGNVQNSLESENYNSNSNAPEAEAEPSFANQAEYRSEDPSAFNQPATTANAPPHLLDHAALHSISEISPEIIIPEFPSASTASNTAPQEVNDVAAASLIAVAPVAAPGSVDTPDLTAVQAVQRRIQERLGQNFGSASVVLVVTEGAYRG